MSKLIQNIRHFPTKSQPAKEAILLCGFGGAIWQTRRLTAVMNRAGYNVTALDFPKSVLSSGDSKALPNLVNEVVAFAEKAASKTDKEILLVGISLGSLLSLNIFRRSKRFKKAVMVTGGNIVTVAKNIYGDKIWPQNHAELSRLWRDINIHSDPRSLKGKRAIFILPTNDKLIDTTEVLGEIDKQNQAGNSIELVKRASYGHIGTIIEETILHPRRILSYIKELED